MQEYIDEYPLIKEFFGIDKETHKVTPKSEEYFMTKLKELEEMEDSLFKREGIYSIKMFLMLLKANKYVKGTVRTISNAPLELEQGIIENVGRMPRR